MIGIINKHNRRKREEGYSIDRGKINLFQFKLKRNDAYNFVDYYYLYCGNNYDNNYNIDYGNNYYTSCNKITTTIIDPKVIAMLEKEKDGKRATTILGRKDSVTVWHAVLPPYSRKNI